MVEKNALTFIASLLVVIGALNWGLVAINMDWNVVEMIFGSIPTLARIVYALVGISGLLSLYWFIREMQK